MRLLFASQLLHNTIRQDSYIAIVVCDYSLPTILPRDAMLARYLLSSCVRPSVRPSVTSRYCIETTGFGMHGGCLPPIPHCFIREFSEWYLCMSKLRTLWISPRQVDHVVNKTRRRRRRRSSLLTTPIRRSTSRGCLNCLFKLNWTASRSTVTPDSIAAICCGFVVQLVSTVDKISTDIARRAVPLR